VDFRIHRDFFIASSFHDFKMNSSLGPWAVKLYQKDSLPFPKHQFGIPDQQGQGISEERGFKVRRSVSADVLEMVVF
jgi:hypothetical protein